MRSPGDVLDLKNVIRLRELSPTQELPPRLHFFADPGVSAKLPNEADFFSARGAVAAGLAGFGKETPVLGTESPPECAVCISVDLEFGVSGSLAFRGRAFERRSIGSGLSSRSLYAGRPIGGRRHGSGGRGEAAFIEVADDVRLRLEKCSQHFRPGHVPLALQSAEAGRGLCHRKMQP